MTSETCQICGKTKNVNAAGHCQGHDNPASSKQRLDAIRAAGTVGRSPVVTEEAPSLSLKEQLDAIPAPAANASAPAPAATPPVGAAGAKKGPGSILGRKTGAGTEDLSVLKSQLDAIPAPGAISGAQPEVSSVPKDLLDSIPTPGTGRLPEAKISKTALDSIPAPGGAAAPLSGASLAEQLNSIPTPAAGAGPAAPEKPPGEVPEWMKNFEKHQSAISASIVAQGGQAPANYGTGGYGGGGGGGAYSTPDAVPTSFGAARGAAEAPPQGSAYNMVIAIVIIICLVMLAYLMISKPTPAVMPPDPSMTTPASSAPSVPSTPVATPSPTPSVPVNSMPAPGGAPQGVTQPGTPPVQGMPPGTPNPNPGAGMPAPATPMSPQGNNPVPLGSPGNNP